MPVSDDTKKIEPQMENGTTPNPQQLEPREFTLTQTDHLNKSLLKSCLNFINQTETAPRNQEILSNSSNSERVDWN